MITPPTPCPTPAVRRWILPAGAELHRFHDPAFAGEAFNPCQGGPTRLAPLTEPTGERLPTLYAAGSREAAAHETIFHAVQHDAPLETVRLWAVESYAYKRLRTRTNLALCQLFEPDLNRWDRTRADLVDTHASQYARTARWAEAIHSAPTVQGLVWTSRRSDPDLAICCSPTGWRPARWSHCRPSASPGRTRCSRPSGATRTGLASP